jgi:hypothetical protein
MMFQLFQKSTTAMRKTCHSCEIAVKPQDFFGITAEECFRVMYLRPHTIENELSATRGTTRQKPFGLEDLDHRVTPMHMMGTLLSVHVVKAGGDELGV